MTTPPLPRFQPYLPALLAAFAALLVYLRTLAPSIYWGDGSELTAAAYLGGVPHSTGYPLYMLLARPWLLLGGETSVAYRMNLLSALSGAAAVGVWAWWARSVLGNGRPAATGALLFAFSLTFWSQAVIAEVYAFHLLLNGLVLLAVRAWDRTGDRRWLGATAFLYGLCFTHHLASVLLVPALLFVGLTSKHRGKLLPSLAICGLLFLLPLGLYLYLPLAAAQDPPLSTGDVRSWQNLLDHVTGVQYRGRTFRYEWPRLGHQLLAYAAPPLGSPGGLLWRQWPLPFLFLVPLGIRHLWREQKRELVVSLLLYTAVVGYSLGYDIPDIDAYYLLSHLVVALWVAVGFHVLLKPLSERFAAAGASRFRRAGLLALEVALLPAVALGVNWCANDLSRDRSALAYGRAALETLARDAVVLVGAGMDYFPLMYANLVERRRPDVMFLDWYDMGYPERLHLTTRLQGKGLTLRVPDDYPQRRGAQWEGNRLLAQVLADNLPRRPFYLYFIGPPEDLFQNGYLAPNLSGYAFRSASNARLLQILQPQSRMFAVGPEVGKPRSLRFTVPTGAPEKAHAAVTLQGYDATWKGSPEAPLLQVRYAWQVHDSEIARKVRVRVLFADPNGNHLPALDDLYAGLHSQHRLGQYFGPLQPELPTRFVEEFMLQFPPDRLPETLHLWMQLSVDGQPLKAGSGNGTPVEIGPVEPFPRR